MALEWDCGFVGTNSCVKRGKVGKTSGRFKNIKFNIMICECFNLNVQCKGSPDTTVYEAIPLQLQNVKSSFSKIANKCSHVAAEVSQFHFASGFHGILTVPFSLACANLISFPAL
jgi:hypothetical protein